MRRADVALYQVKSGGKDAVAAYDDGMADAVVHPPRRPDPPAFVGILTGLRDVARTIDEREAPGGGHSERVADLAERIALELGWSRDRAALLREAGLMHDVGKIGVPDEVLAKPGPLTPEERASVQHHAELGARMAADVLQPEQVAWIRSHHEQPDGRGYPDGLRGVEVPDGALVIAVAEAFDALTHRPPLPRRPRRAGGARRAAPRRRPAARPRRGRGAGADPHVGADARGELAAVTGAASRTRGLVRVPVRRRAR